jgi:hypothetical protein
VNIDLHDSLARRADSVEPPRFDASTIAVDGERLVRRRRRVAASTAALAAVIIVMASLLGGHRPQRVDPAPDHGVVRPVTYGVGRVLHLGDRELDTRMDFLSIDVTDDGAALTTFDGGIWFTDGVAVEQVGQTLPLRAFGRGANSGVAITTGRPREWVVNDSSGSLLAWVGYRDGDRDRPELVVYDTDRRAVVSRRPLEPGEEVGRRPVHQVAAVVGRQVFLSTRSSNGLVAPALERFSLDGEEVVMVGKDAVEAAVRAQARALVIGPSAELGDVALQVERAWDFGHLDRVAVADGVTTELYDARTGRPLALRVPGQLTALWIVQWVDDDRVTAVTGEVPRGDLLVCHISTASCEKAVDRSAWDHAGPNIPGFGGTGADYAMKRAADASRR